MKPKVAVICAFNPGNAGMFSVDRAAGHTFERLGADYTLINFQKKLRHPSFAFKVVRDPQDLAAFSHVLFWGDFQNNPIYGKRDFASREIKYGHAATYEEGLASWRVRHLDLVSHLPRSTVVASVGNCFLGAEDALDTSALRTSFRAFLTEFHLVMPRDDQSVAELERIADKTAKCPIVPGVDLAFLQPSSTLRVRSAAPGFGYFFGRSKLADTAGCIDFLARTLGLEPIKIPWLTGRHDTFCGVVHTIAMHRLKRCRFVVTDVYHLAVNAMNSGVPVICLSRANGQTGRSVDDAKKFALMELLGGEAFHITVPDDGSLLGLQQRIAETYLTLEKSPALLDTIQERLSARRAISERRISDMLSA